MIKQTRDDILCHFVVLFGDLDLHLVQQDTIRVQRGNPLTRCNLQNLTSKSIAELCVNMAEICRSVAEIGGNIAETCGREICSILN